MKQVALTSGRVFSLLVLLVLSLVTITGVVGARSQSAKGIRVRPIAGLPAMEEIIGRATETGRPIHFTTGIGQVEVGDQTARVLGGLQIMSWVANRSAAMDAQLVVSVCRPTTYAVTSEIFRNAYHRAGRPEAYRDTMVRFLSDNQFAFATGAAAIMQEEKVSGNIMVGSFGAESLFIAETGNTLGAMQVAGDTNMFQIPFFVVTCDYTLIGEEMFAAGAVLTDNREALASLQAQDLGKALAMALMILGALMATAGKPVLSTWIKW